MAKKDKNEPQLLKAFFFKSKYMQMLEPDAQVLILDNLQAEIKTATPATKALMESLYAQMLLEIYSRNSYNIENRTHVAGPAPKNTNEWSTKNFTDAINAAYLRSIANRELLYKTPLSKYDAIVEFAPVLANTNRSVYDFLLSTYLDYERTAPNHKRAGIHPANYPYIFADEAAFQQATAMDTVSGAGGSMGLKLCQEAEAFYMQKKDTYALQRAVLRRLEYAYKEIWWAEKNETYIKILGQLATTWGDSPFAYRALLGQAQLYDTTARKTDRPDYKDKALQVCEIILKNKDKHDVAFEAEAIRGPIINRMANLTIEQYITPGQPSLGKIAFKNPEPVTISFYKIKQPEGEKYNFRYLKNNTQFQDSLLKTTPVLKKTYQLPAAPGHFDYTTEVMLPPLQKGAYIVVISPVKDSITSSDCGFTTTQVAQIALAQQRNDNKTVYYITDRNTGQPIEGVVATSGSVTYTSGDDGKIYIPSLKNDKGNGYKQARFIYDGDTHEFVVEPHQAIP
ncbi:MAG: hypothetical protein V4581_10140 [Bacteroidota bacterium]